MGISVFFEGSSLSFLIFFYTFSSNGYDIVEMLGQPYDEGLKASVNFIPDEDLNKNEQIITKIIKPQVNYQGVMIQAAQIEVSQGG